MKITDFRKIEKITLTSEAYQRKTVSHKTKGFTVIEVMIAVVIFSIGILVIIGAFQLVYKLTQYNREITIATNVAESRLEELRRQGFSNLVNNNNPSPVAVPSLKNGYMKTYINDHSSSLIKIIRVTIYWENRPESNAVELTTLIGQGGISG